MNKLVPKPGHFLVSDRSGVRQVRKLDMPPAPVVEEAPIEVYTAAALTSQQLVAETTSATDRAQGGVIRMIPMTIILGVLAVGLRLIAPGISLAWFIILFAAVSIGGYIAFTWLDYRHSAAGIELSRIHTASTIKRTELAHQFHLKRMALETYLRLLERHHADD